MTFLNIRRIMFFQTIEKLQNNPNGKGVSEQLFTERTE